MTEIIIATPDVDELLKEHLPLECRMIRAPLGRGAALSAGVHEAKGEWLLIVHADTVLSAGWWGAAQKFMETHANDDIAGYFKFRLNIQSASSRLIELFVALRCMLFALPYGDQGLLLRKEVYNRLGGYRSDYPIMEDVDLIRRIGRRRLIGLDVYAVTSGDRYAHGHARRVARNAHCLGLYFSGTHPKEIVKLYERP